LGGVRGFAAMKILSWNVNGVRAALGKGLLDWMTAAKADVICLQEVKATVGDVQHVEWPKGYEVAWNSAEKKGYSGTALFMRRKPLAVTRGIGSPAHDAEGRALTAEFDDCYVIGVYVPNAQPELARIGFRQEWDRALLAYAKKLEKKKPVVFCGDLNVAHEEIDLARPKENVGNPGFSDQERDGFREFIGAGFVDTFREFEKGAGPLQLVDVSGGRARAEHRVAHRLRDGERGAETAVQARVDRAARDGERPLPGGVGVEVRRRGGRARSGGCGGTAAKRRRRRKQSEWRVADNAYRRRQGRDCEKRAFVSGGGA
jgi:exodeoxyribonuclease-3